MSGRRAGNGPGVADSLQRWAAARWWRATGRPERDRRALYGGATGLRVVCFHGTPPDHLEQVKRIVAWWRSRSPIASLDEVDALFAGAWRSDGSDELLLTFDDGLASHYEAAKWLADVGLPAIFFVVPSLVDRTVAEYV